MSSALCIVALFLWIQYSETAPCINYGNYTITNGEDISLNLTNEIKYANLGPNYVESNSNSTAQFFNFNRTCTHTDGCEYICDETGACAQGSIHCNSPIGCNIKCLENFSCGELSIYAQTHSTTNLTITCYKDACTSLKLNIFGINSAHLHCIGTLACLNVIATFNNVSWQSIQSSVSCYHPTSCNNLQMYSSNQYSQLIMYEYSSNIHFHNNFGYYSSHPNILCGLQNKYIQYNFNNNSQTIQQLILNEYSLQTSHLPCENITVLCFNNSNNNSILNNSCSMDYIIHENNIDRFITDSRFENDTCAYIALEDIIELTCNGECKLLPTYAPTNTPTHMPSFSPSQTPSISPINIPSNSPSLSPTISPLTPTGIPSLSPTISPTQSPSNTPTISPTQSPTRFPTQISNQFNTKMNIIYVFTNLTQINYTNITNDMESIIESSYFDQQLLPKYKYFSVQIENISNKNRNIIYVKSIVYSFEEYSKYILITSRALQFESWTQYLFQNYFNNSQLIFSVSNKSMLTIEKISNYQKDDGFGIVFWIITAIILSCVMGAICVTKCNKICKTNEFCLPTDSINWISLIFLCLSICDSITNVSMAVEILKWNLNWNKWNGIICILFIILRIILNIFYIFNYAK